MARKASEKVLGLLQDCVIVANGDQSTLTIPFPLERKDYLALNDALKGIGGKWNGRAKKHLFPYDPTPLIEQILITRELPDKNPTAFFPTPRPLVEAMLGFIDMDFFAYCTSQERVSEKKYRVLEPSAGIGGIADVVREKATDPDQLDLVCVEILPENQMILENKGHNVVKGSFLDFPVPEKEEEFFDLVLMNPPFSVKGDTLAYMTHIYHAFDMLRPDGELVAIIPTGWLTNEGGRFQAFRNFVGEYIELGGHEVFEKGAFKSSGTMVETVAINLRKSSWRQKPYGGQINNHVWNFVMEFTNSSEHIDKLCKYTEDQTKKGKNLKSKYTVDRISFIVKRIVKTCIKDHFMFLPDTYTGDYINAVFNYAEIYFEEDAEFEALTGFQRTSLQPLKSVEDEVIDAHAEWVKENRESISSFLGDSGMKFKDLLERTRSWSDGQKEEAEAFQEVPIEVEIHSDTVPLEEQGKILRSGGNLFDLMVA